MPPKKKHTFTPEAEARIRQSLQDWMTQNGHDEKSFARLLNRKPETVALNLGAARLKTKRPISGAFVDRVQRATGLTLIEPEVAPLEASSPPLPEGEPRQEIVAFVGRAGLARAGQLARLVRRSPSQFNRIAAAMVKDKLLARERDSAPDGLSRAQEYLYGLAPAGLALAAKQLGRSVRSCFTQGHLKAGLFVDHNLLVTEVALRLSLELGAALSDWAVDADSRDEVRASDGRAAVEPDLIFRLDAPAGPRGRWVEVETGQQGQGAISRKVTLIDQYYLAGGARRRWQTERWLVLWIGRDEAHARRLQDWIGPLRPQVMHWCTSWDWITQFGIAGRVWLALNTGDARHALADHLQKG